MAEEENEMEFELGDRTFPFPLTDNLKILGVIIDNWFTLEDHFRQVLTKAPVRQGILQRVAGCRWGLEVGILSMTNDSIVESLLRYALNVLGACLPHDLIKKANTQILNIMARRIGAIGRTARIETLHFYMNTQTIQNMGVVHTAHFLDSCLRAEGSTIKARLLEELCAYYGAENFETQD